MATLSLINREVVTAIMKITQADIDANIPALQQAIRALTRFQREELAEWILNSADFNDAIAETALGWGIPPERHPLTVEEFLAIETGGSVRHEYIGGEMFEMRVPMPRHEMIVANLLRHFREQLGGHPSTLVASSLGLRLRVEQTELFYRPDVMVACMPPPAPSQSSGPNVLGQHNVLGQPHVLDQHYVTDPRVIVEVFSPITEDIDRREKVLNYRRIAALEEYLLIAQRSPQVIVLRRAEDWSPIELTALDAVVESRSMQLSISLQEIYEGTSLR
jgi:Uma2 family endonuclease